MPDIKTITLPSGNTYNIHDEVAREAIAALQNTENVLSTDAASTPYGVTWMDGSTEITGTLVASADTVKKIYLVPAESQDAADNNFYNEYLTLKISNVYQWEKIGSTKIDLSGLGDLAWKDTASASYTPAGSVSQPSFSGDQLTSTGTFTPSGSIAISSGSGTINYTPTGEVSQPSFSGNQLVSSGLFVPNGAVSIALGSGTANYTPTGTITVPTISVDTAGNTADIGSMTSIGTLPSLVATVNNGNLTLTWAAGTLPSFSNVTVKTGDASYTASTPSFIGTSVQLKGTFTGTEGSINVTGTPTGTVSQPLFTGTGVHLAGTFSGSQGSISVIGTPTGTVSQPSFTGTAATITVS